jgi:hypothetical protein
MMASDDEKETRIIIVGLINGEFDISIQWTA